MSQCFLAEPTQSCAIAQLVTKALKHSSLQTSLNQISLCASQTHPNNPQTKSQDMKMKIMKVPTWIECSWKWPCMTMQHNTPARTAPQNPCPRSCDGRASLSSAACHSVKCFLGLSWCQCTIEHQMNVQPTSTKPGLPWLEERNPLSFLLS